MHHLYRILELRVHFRDDGPHRFQLCKHVFLAAGFTAHHARHLPRVIRNERTVGPVDKPG